MTRWALGLCLMAGALVGVAGAAQAHPHVWIAARAEIVFDTTGKVAGIRHSWVFDEMYSAFATQGLGDKEKPPTREQLAPLAKSNVEGLTEFDYFTVVKAGGVKSEFLTPTDYYLEADATRAVTLNFFLPLKTPVSATKALSVQVYDPTYLIDFKFERTEPVVMKGAPQGCSLNISGADPLKPDETKKLSESFFTGLSPGADFGVKLAARVTVACP